MASYSTLNKLSDLSPDDRNANRGTKRGNAAIENSLRTSGAGRSIVIDRNGKIIAGNKTVANAQAAGIDDLIVVESDGSKIIAVQRMDLDLEHDSRAKALAVADNRCAELSLDWDPVILAELATDIDMEPYFAQDELRKIGATTNEPTDAPESFIEYDESIPVNCQCPDCGYVWSDGK